MKSLYTKYIKYVQANGMNTNIYSLDRLSLVRGFCKQYHP